MPKIEVNEQQFFELLGETMNAGQLEAILTVAKAELDGWEHTGPASERTIKIELNDTNRPDLWSTAGVARQLRVYRGGSLPLYPFFSREGEMQKAEYRVVVDASVESMRPYMATFVISGKPISDAMLKDSIQTQEKLCANFGRKRRSVSMGMYRIELIKWPVAYRAVDPDTTSFTPLQTETPMDLRHILA